MRHCHSDRIISDINGFLNSINFDVLSKGWTKPGVPQISPLLTIGFVSSTCTKKYSCLSFLGTLGAAATTWHPLLTFADYGTHATFSYVLTLLVELGPLGLITYVYFIGGLMVGLHANNERR